MYNLLVSDLMLTIVYLVGAVCWRDPWWVGTRKDCVCPRTFAATVEMVNIYYLFL